MEKSYLINSKIDVPRSQSSIKRLKFLKFFIIASFVLAVMSFLLDEFKTTNLRYIVLSLAFYFYYKNRVVAHQGGAVFTTVEAMIKQGEMVLDYSKIDRRDGMGSRREVITFPNDKILGLEYNTNLLCLRIAGKPTIQIQYENQKKYPGTKLQTNGEETIIHLLYLDAANAGDFLQTLGEFTNVKIEHKEQFSSGTPNQTI